MLKKYLIPTNFMLLGFIFLAIGIPCDGFLRGFENVGLMFLLGASILNYQNFEWAKLLAPENICLYILFLLCVFGYLYTDDMIELNRKTALKVLLVLFPMAFSTLPRISERMKGMAINIFSVTTAVIALLTCIDYLLHFASYNKLIQESKPISVIGGTMHIYFSVMLALSIFLALHRLNKNAKIVLTSFSDKLLATCILINVLALHILSARTGLLAFYAALLVLLFRFSFQTKRFKTLIGGLFVIIIFPVLMYIAVPSVKNRINNSYDDVRRYYSGEYVGYFSISGRFETWKVALHIFSGHKLFGVGYGDLQRMMESQYRIDTTRLMREEGLANCHNQYLETLTAHGLIGIAVFLCLLFFMLRQVKRMPRNNFLMVSFLTVFLISFLVESLLEREAGITLFLFFYFLIKNNAYDCEKSTAVAP